MINFSELLWKSEPKRGRRSSGPGSTDPSGISSVLNDVAVEQVEVRPDSRMVYLLDPRSPAAERLRLLRMRLRELKETVRLRSLVVTSALPQDGKSTVALNLATVLAENGSRSVLLIEADLHRPTLSTALGLVQKTGLAECLEKGADPMSAIRRIEPLGIHLLQAGVAAGNPTELLQSDALGELFSSLLPHFDWVLVDSPPVLLLTDPLTLAQQVDASLLVVRADRTPRELVDQAIAQLGPQHVAAVVLNCAQTLENSSYYGAYYNYTGKKT